MPLGGESLTAVPVEAAEQAQQALRVIAAENPEALSEPSLMASLLADLLPDGPRTARLIVAATENRIADQLREHAAQGMDATTASRLVAAAFGNATLLRPEACAWVVGEIAVVVGVTDGDARPPTIVSAPPSREGETDRLAAREMAHGGKPETGGPADRPEPDLFGNQAVVTPPPAAAAQIPRLGAARWSVSRRQRRTALLALAAVTVVAAAAVLLAVSLGQGPVPRRGHRPYAAARLVAASFPAPGSGPEALAFDGHDLWMTDDSSEIFQVDIGGQIDASYPSPDSSPEGITWDGRSFWLYTADLGLIYHVQIRNGGVRTLGSINPHPRFAGLIHNVVWAGGDIWWSEEYKAELITPAAKVLRQITMGSEIAGLAWDGTHLWFAYDNFPNGSRIEEATSSGTEIRTFTVPITGLSSLVWADNSLWTLGQNTQGAPTRVYRLSL